MASVYTEGQLLHPSDPPLPVAAKHKRRRRNDAELTFPSPRRAVAQLPAVTEWLLELPAGERQQALVVENCWATSMLRQMLARKMRDGEVVFTPISKNSRYESGKLEDYYIVSKPSREMSNSEVEFEQNLRLCDSSQYIDTVTVSLDLVNDCVRFLRLADVVSAGEAFRSPCRVFWDTSSKSWTWECPAWTAGKALSLSQFALALFEKSCWQCFFQSSKLDPRAPGETFAYLPDQSPAPSSDTSNLVAFWKSLDREKRVSLAGDQSMLATEFTVQKSLQKEMQWKSQDLVHSSCQSASFLTLFANSSPYYTSLRNKMQQYMTQGSVEQLRKSQSDLGPGEFIDYLVKAPLERAGTVFDLVARSVLLRIREAQKTQIADDLLQHENRLEKPTRKRKSHKKKPRRASSNASTACSPNTRISPNPVTDRETNPSHEVAQFIIDLVLRQMVLCIPEADADFQTVQSNRRKPKKQNNYAGTGRMRKFKPKVKPVQPPSTLLHSAPTSPVVIKWAREEPSSVVTFKPAVDFPPLAVSQVVNFDSLTSEMTQFRAQTQEEMTRRSRVMGFLVTKLQEIMSCLFPGAYLAIFGSYATGLALPSSDLDVALVNAGVYVDDVTQAVSMLEEVLPAYRWVESIKGIATATVPVVKLMVNPQYFSRDIQDLIQVDITFEDQTYACSSPHLGMATCAWVQDLLLRYPQASACFLVLKHLLLKYQLNSTYHGGLSSYSLVLWMNAYVKQHGQDSMGELLMGFLKFYGMEFNAKMTGVRTGSDLEGYFQRQQPAFTPCETIDPLRSDNNTTKGAFRIAEVQELFRRAFEFLSASVAHGQHNPLSRLLAKSDLIKV